MANKRSLFGEFVKGVLHENPVLRLMLGTCPTLAVSISLKNALGMGAAATLVLMGSNAVISALRKVIPGKVRIPAYITVIAGFVGLIQMALKAYLPALDQSLGIFLPLIVVNCIILARAEIFASQNKVIPSVIDGLGMGVGFTVVLCLIAAIRELIGNGTLWGAPITSGFIEPMLVMVSAPGGFFVFGVLVALSSKLGENNIGHTTDGDPCHACPSLRICSRGGNGKENA